MTLLTTVDLVLLIFALLFFWGGWRKGLLRVLITPLSFLICTLLGIVHFDTTEDLAGSLLIATLGTFILSGTIKFILMLTRKTVEKKYRN